MISPQEIADQKLRKLLVDPKTATSARTIAAWLAEAAWLELDITIYKPGKDLMSLAHRRLARDLLLLLKAHTGDGRCNVPDCNVRRSLVSGVAAARRLGILDAGGADFPTRGERAKLVRVAWPAGPPRE